MIGSSRLPRASGKSPRRQVCLKPITHPPPLGGCSSVGGAFHLFLCWTGLYHSLLMSPMPLGLLWWHVGIWCSLPAIGWLYQWKPKEEKKKKKGRKKKAQFPHSSAPHGVSSQNAKFHPSTQADSVFQVGEQSKEPFSTISGTSFKMI